MNTYIEQNFLEESVYRKQKIFEYLIVKKKGHIRDICEDLNISSPTLYKEIDQINEMETSFLKIKTGMVWLNLKNEEQVTSFLKKLYEQSDFLTMLSFYLFNTTKNKSFELPISRSKFYYVKSKVLKFLQLNDLEIRNQIVIGSRLKINWIKAILNVKYRIYSIKKTDFIYYQTEKFIHKINNIENCYLTDTESNIFLYHIYYILKNPNEVTLTTEEERILSLTISPRFLENELKNLFNINNFNRNENLLNYAKLCYFLLNTHAISPKITFDHKNKIENLLLNYPEIAELIYKIENRLNIKVKENEIVLNILFNHLKLCLINWQLPYNIDIIDNPIYDDNPLIKIFVNWSKKNNLDMTFPPSVLNSLFEKLSQLKKLDDSPKLFIYTDSWAKYIEISTFLQNNLAVKIPLIDYWVSSKEELLSQVQSRDCIISDNYFFSYSNNHENIFYLPSPSEVELNNISKKIIDCLINTPIAN